jgi:peptidoglycan/xylan/chitin deacetylase (PgdA/CDA1 family)
MSTRLRPLARHGRYDYVPIRGRPIYDWPGATRLAVYVAVNLEHFAFGEGLGGELVPSGPQPDVLNYAWRDYGNRVGAWRLLDLLDELQLPAAALPNAAIYDYCPALIEAHRLRGDEIVGHGWSNSERQGVLDEADEARLIAEVTAKYSGTRPAGWLGPWLSESRATPDLLQEAGYRYLLDWCMDDQPVWMKTRGGRILAVPYPQELNDIPAIMVRRTGASDFADAIVDNFTEMRRQASNGPLVMGIALHPYLIGQPFRLLHLRRAFRHIVAAGAEIWLTQPGAIARHIESLPEGIVPGSVKP